MSKREKEREHKPLGTATVWLCCITGFIFTLPLPALNGSPSAAYALFMSAGARPWLDWFVWTVAAETIPEN